MAQIIHRHKVRDLSRKLMFLARDPVALQIHGHRGIADLARAIGIATETLRDFMNRTSSDLISETIERDLAFLCGFDPTSSEWLFAGFEEFRARYLYEARTSRRAGAMEQLSSVEQSSLGATFDVVDDQLVIAPSGQNEDEIAAKSPIVQALHEQVLRKGQSLQPTLLRLNNQLGWNGTAPALERFLSYIRDDTSHVAARIGDVWSCVVELGSYLELDRRLQPGSPDTISPLDPEVRRQFSDLIRTAAPFVRQFPSARMLDDESGAFLSRKLFLESADEVLQQANSVALVSAKDRQLLEGLIAAAARGDFQGTKAESRVCSSAKNLVLASAGIVATFYMGSIASNHSNISPIAKRAAEAIVMAEKPIIKLFEDSPADIRLALEALIQQIRADRDQAPAAPLPSKAALIPGERRRKRNAEHANVGSQVITDRILDTGWRLNFRPLMTGGTKRISFNEDGTIGEGQNANEHTWRINGAILELIRADGSLHNRFEYDPDTDRFVSHQPSAVHGIPGQLIYRDKS